MLRVLCLVPLLVLAGACSMVEPEPDPDNERLVGAVTAFVDTLGRGEYAAAVALGCPDVRSEADLRAEFEPHPRPWKRFVTYTTRSDASGNANLDLTPSGAPVVRYTFDLTRRPDGSWTVCDVTRGSIQVDVG